MEYACQVLLYQPMEWSAPDRIKRMKIMETRITYITCIFVNCQTIGSIITVMLLASRRHETSYQSSAAGDRVCVVCSFADRRKWRLPTVPGCAWRQRRPIRRDKLNFRRPRHRWDDATEFFSRRLRVAPPGERWPKQVPVRQTIDMQWMCLVQLNLRIARVSSA